MALALLLAVGCAPAAGPGGSSEAPAGQAPQLSRTMVVATRGEPSTLSSRLGDGLSLSSGRRMFTATLVLLDRGGDPQPYLATEIPQVNTDTWRVLPDGRMETTYRLKPNLTWHDGAALTANDFVYAWQVYASPAAGSGNLAPIGLMDEVVATDPLTVLVKWKSPYPEAAQLASDFPPLPRHILESSLQTTSVDQFLAHPFWTQQWVGAGPYKLERWEPGAFIDGSAFSGHVLGAPKIDRVRLVFISDPNTALANLLASEIHLAADDSIRFQQGVILTREWGPRNGGKVVHKVSLWRGTHVQFHPERLMTPGLADLRVRKALAHTVDKDGLNEVLFEGQGIMSDVPFIPSTMSYIATVERTATKYAYDVNRAQAYLSEAGYGRGADGVWASPTAGRLSFNLMTSASTQNEAEMAVLGSGWRRVGFDPQESVMPAAQAQDGMARTVFPGLSTISLSFGEKTLVQMSTAGTSAEENRWTGSNRGNWSNAEFDRHVDALARTLDPRQRVDAIAEMVRIYSDQLPALPLYFNPVPAAHTSALVGPQPFAPGADLAWDVHTWEMR